MRDSEIFPEIFLEPGNFFSYFPRRKQSDKIQLVRLHHAIIISSGHNLNKKTRLATGFP
jgi:hypothetical protein